MNDFLSSPSTSIPALCLSPVKIKLTSASEGVSIISICSLHFSFIPSRGVISYGGKFVELPAPKNVFLFAFTPITAIFLNFSIFNGRIFPSFFNSTMPSSAILRANSWCSEVFRLPCGKESSSSNNPTRNITLRSRLTLSLRTSSVNFPSSKACFILVSVYLFGVGISKVKPEFIQLSVLVVVLVAPQSETTKPLNPHSFINTSLRRCMCSEA